MRTMPLKQRGISDSRLALGCMGLGGSWSKDESYTQDVSDRRKQRLKRRSKSALPCSTTQIFIQ